MELISSCVSSKINCIIVTDYSYKSVIITINMETSVLFDGTIDTADENIGGVEPNGASQKPEASDHDESIAKVEKGRNKIHDVELEEGEGKKKLIMYIKWKSLCQVLSSIYDAPKLIMGTTKIMRTCKGWLSWDI